MGLQPLTGLAGHVNPIGLHDLDRRRRPAGAARAELIRANAPQPS